MFASHTRRQQMVIDGYAGYQPQQPPPRGIREYRAIIRGWRPAPFLAAELREYLPGLVAVIGMRAFTEPVAETCHEPPYPGPSAWIGITTSGIQVHAFPALDGDPPYVVTDIFSCRPFITEGAREYTAMALGLDPCRAYLVPAPWQQG